jgi:hypothetical protein
MTIKTIDCKTAEEAFTELLKLSHSREIYFRGLSDGSHDLSSTYSRHTTNPHLAVDLEPMVDHFVNAVVSTGKPLPFETEDLRGKLEYARSANRAVPAADHLVFSPLPG